MKHIITLLTLALLIPATPAQAASVATLTGTDLGDQVLLEWSITGEADGLTLHWINATGEQGSLALDAGSTSITLAASVEGTTYVLAVESDGVVTLSNPYTAGGGPCPPEQWVVLYTGPPFIFIRWDCLP